MLFRQFFSLLAMVMMASLAQAELHLKSGHVRAMPPGQPNTTAFMVLMNHSNQDVTLVAAKTQAANKAEFHSHTMDKMGVMQMRPVAQVTIPAGGQFEFKSGAHHVMLMGLKTPLKPEENVELVLVDSTNHEHRFTLPVKSLIAPQEHHGHHHHH